jgi:Holin of 3TMs, for gene-transfer release
MAKVVRRAKKHIQQGKMISQKGLSAMMPSSDWMSAYWRPAMGWTYMAICIFDFIIFPVGWSATLAGIHQTVTEWQPLTLQGGGLFHMSMGAILGVAAWSRGQEKMTAMNLGMGSMGGMGGGGVVQQETSYDSQTPINSAPNFGSAKVPQSPQSPLD